MSRKLDLQVKRLVQRVGLLRAAHRALWVGAAFLFLWGLLVLALRFGFGLPAADGLWGLIGLPIVVLAAAVFEWRRRPTPIQMRALLDETNDAGGLIMAADETESWSHILPSTRLPAFHWDKRTPVLFAAAALAFLLAAFFVPRSFANPLATQSHRLEIQREMQTLLDQVDTLEKADQLDDEAAQELREALAQIQADADGRDPERTWEALDQLQKSMEEEGATAANQTANQIQNESALEDATREIARQIEEGAANETIAEALKDLAERLDEDALERALAAANDNPQLQKALEKLKDGDDGALKELAKELAEKIGPEALKDLADNLRQNQNDLMRGLEELGGKGLIPPEQLQKLLGQAQGEGEGEGEGDGKGGGGLADFLNDPANKPDPEGKNGMGPGGQGQFGQGQGDQPGNGFGQGGINRGPGHGPLNLSGNTTRDGAAFTPETLPLSRIQALRESKLLGLSMSTPQAGTKLDTASGALSGAKAGAGSAHTQVIHPRHRGAVESFFAR